MRDFAKVICRAAKVYEESWDTEEKMYQLTLRMACVRAIEETNYDTHAEQPMYLLLNQCWNSVLAWAESII